MNFLSHFYLSGDQPDIILGNFMGDFVKGKQINNYEEKVSKGIFLHREIDFFTDSHPVVRQSKQKLRNRYRHYAGVVTDIFYDHFLATNWKIYSDISLYDFTQKSYNVIIKRKSILPAPAQFMLPYMVEENWLASYATIDGIDKACQGLSRRTKFRSNMEYAAEDLKLHYTDFQREFNNFFPQIIEHVRGFMDKQF